MNYLDLMTDGILIVDRDYTVIFANKAVLDFIDVPSDRIVGEKCRTAYRLFNAPCSIQNFVCPHESVIERGESKRAVYECKSRDGQERILALLPVLWNRDWQSDWSQ